MRLFILGVLSLLMAISTSAQYVPEGVEVFLPVDGAVNLRRSRNKLEEPEFLLSEIGGNVPSLVSKINVEEPDIMDPIGGIVPGIETLPEGNGDVILLEETVDIMEVEVECNPACPLLFKPVCGGLPDGREETFSNECQLKVRNCLNRIKYEVLRTGRC